MNIPLRSLILLLPLLAACSSSMEATHHPLQEAVKAGICHVHHVPLVQETVPITYGLPGPADTEPEAKLTKFPFASRIALGGCVISPDAPKTSTVWLCPSCLESRQTWMTQHPNDPWVQRQRVPR